DPFGYGHGGGGVGAGDVLSGLAGQATLQVGGVEPQNLHSAPLQRRRKLNRFPVSRAAKDAENHRPVRRIAVTAHQMDMNLMEKPVEENDLSHLSPPVRAGSS